MIHHAKALAKREGKKFVKFLIVGGASFLIHFLGYALLSRVLFPGGPLTVLNLIAMGVSMVFNYLAQSMWTYRAPDHNVGQMLRYVFVVATQALLQAFLFWIGVEKLGLYDLLVVVVNGGICALYSFVAHRLFTFRRRGSQNPPAVI